MEKKMTKRDYFNEVIELANEKGRADIVAFAEHEIELLDNKASKKSDTKKAKEQAEVKDKIISALTGFDKAVTISKMLQTDELNGYTPQKISALVRQLILDGEVERTEVKKVAYFKLAD